MPTPPAPCSIDARVCSVLTAADFTWGEAAARKMVASRSERKAKWGAKLRSEVVNQRRLEEAVVDQASVAASHEWARTA